MRLERVGGLPVASAIAPVFLDNGDVVVAGARELVRFTRDDGVAWREDARHPTEARALAAANGALASSGGRDLESCIRLHDPRTLASIASARGSASRLAVGAGFVATGHDRVMAALALPRLTPVAMTDAPPARYEDLWLTAFSADPASDLVVAADDGGSQEDGVGRNIPSDEPRILFHRAGASGIARCVPARRHVHALAFDGPRRRVLVADETLYALDIDGNLLVEMRFGAHHIAVGDAAVVATSLRGLWLLRAEDLELLDAVDIATKTTFPWVAASADGFVAVPEDDRIALYRIRTAARSS